MKQIKSTVWGIAIIALGVIFGGNALGLFNINVFFDGWWTLFIIIPSLVALFTDKDKLMNLIFLLAGIIFLLAAQNIFSYEVASKIVLALALIGVGVSIIVRGFFRGKNNKEVEQKVHDAKEERKTDVQTAIFSGNDRVYKNETFSGANLTAVFGGIDLDLRNAKFTKDTTIKAFCLFGGIDIKVPENVQVKIKSGFIFGGASDERKGEATGKYTLYIDATGGFGGLEVSDKGDKK